MKPIYLIGLVAFGLTACSPENSNPEDSPLKHRFTTNVENSDSGYLCEVQETVFAEKNGVEYELINLVDEIVADPSHCVTTDFATRTSKRYLMHTVKTSEYTDLSQRIFFRDSSASFDFLTDWFDLRDSLDSVSSDALFSAFEAYQHDFNDWAEMLGYDGEWSKLRTYRNEDRTVWVRRTTTGLMRIETHNGSSDTQCSDDAVLWTDC